MLAAAESARYIVHGSGSYVKYGLILRRTSEKWRRLPQEDWGYDMRDGGLPRGSGTCRRNAVDGARELSAYYAAIRDALNGDGENPVPASQAIN